MTKTILLIDDDALMRRSLAFNLEKAGYKIKTAANAEDGLQVVKRDPPDLVLLDIGLPGMDGLDLLRILKDQIGIPVILVTARRRELDEVLGLELGADDYITKPFDLDVLLARVKKELRRTASAAVVEAPTEVITAGKMAIDPAAHVVNYDGREINLAPREFDLLKELVANAGKVIPTDNLLNQVWGAEFVGQPQVVYVHIRWLREKIEIDPMHPKRILTVRGVGYKYVPEDGQYEPA